MVLLAGRFRQQMGRANNTGQACLGVYINGCHEIQPQEREVGKVVLGQLLTAKVSVQAAKAVESLFTKPASCLRRNDYPRRVADNHVLDVASPVDEHSDLTTDFSGYFAYLTRELRCDDFMRRDSTLVDSLETLQLVRLKAVSLAFNLWNG